VNRLCRSYSKRKDSLLRIAFAISPLFLCPYFALDTIAVGAGSFVPLADCGPGARFD
jgi:hypothetical protein